MEECNKDFYEGRLSVIKSLFENYVINNSNISLVDFCNKYKFINITEDEIKVIKSWINYYINNKHMSEYDKIHKHLIQSIEFNLFKTLESISENGVHNDINSINEIILKFVDGICSFIRLTLLQELSEEDFVNDYYELPKSNLDLLILIENTSYEIEFLYKYVIKNMYFSKLKIYLKHLNKYGVSNSNKLIKADILKEIKNISEEVCSYMLKD